MYLDNIMNKNWQKIMYAFIGIIAILLTVSGIMFWVSDVKADNEDALDMQYVNAGLSVKFMAVCAAVCIVTSSFVIYTFKSNKLAIKKQSNNFQMATIGLIITSVVIFIYVAWHNYDIYKTYYNFHKLAKLNAESNDPILQALSKINNIKIDISRLRYYGMWVGIIGSAISVVPIGIYIRRSNSFWR